LVGISTYHYRALAGGAEGKNLRAVVGPRPSGRGVVDSKFLRAASPIFFIFYARAQSFGYFSAGRKVTSLSIESYHTKC